MKLIKLNKDYKEQLRKVYSLVFEDGFEEEYCEFCLNHDNFWKQTYGWVDGEKLVSTYTNVEVEVQVRKKAFKAHYLDGLATLPTYRNQGLIKKMFLDNITRCKKSDIPIILLNPFKHSYYKKLGFEVSTESNTIQMEFDLLSRRYDCADYNVKMDYLKDDKILQEDYKKINEWLWDNSPYSEMKLSPSYEETKFQHKDIIIAIMYDGNNKPQGYMIYSEKDETLEIVEFRYTNLNAFYALKRHILSYRDQVKKIVFSKVSNDFPLGLLADDFWRTEKKIKIIKNLSRMMRIIDLEKVFNTLICQPPKNEISIYITDDLINENEGRYLISTNGKIQKLENKDIERKNIEVSISDIVPLISGRKSATQLYFEGRLKISDEKIIYHSINHIPDIIKEVDEVFPKIVSFDAEVMMSI